MGINLKQSQIYITFCNINFWIDGLHIHVQLFKMFQNLNAISLDDWRVTGLSIWIWYIYFLSVPFSQIIFFCHFKSSPKLYSFAIFFLCFLQLFEIVLLLQVFHPYIRWNVLFVNLIHLYVQFFPLIFHMFFFLFLYVTWLITKLILSAIGNCC